MFSKNAYIFPHGSPSSHPHRASNDCLLYHHDMFSGHLNAAALYNQDVGGGVDPSAAAASMRATKKDRHSKINTAQGPRDRRVRLSIGVARKFFDLQETLGFDKPSKTLDWLLTKSKAAINDLEQLRDKAGAGDSECEVDSKQKPAVESNKLKGAATQASSLAKESRVKARARARERTREKMKLNETTRNINGGATDLTPIQFINNQLEFRKISASSSSSNINLGFREAMLHYEPTNEDLIQESIVIKRKAKHHPSILGFHHQKLLISSSKYGVQTPYNAAAAENWDNICTILDQHKFINSR